MDINEKEIEIKTKVQIEMALPKEDQVQEPVMKEKITYKELLELIKTKRKKFKVAFGMKKELDTDFVIIEYPATIEAGYYEVYMGTFEQEKEERPLMKKIIKRVLNPFQVQPNT